MHLHLKRRVGVPTQDLYEVVADVERYPEFLPGWRSVRVIRHDTRTLVVEQQIGLGPVVLRFRSTARPRPPSAVTISSDNGPFRRLVIDWSIKPDEEGQTEVALDIDITARGGLVAPLIESNFQRIAHELIPRFVDRARRAG